MSATTRPRTGYLRLVDFIDARCQEDMARLRDELRESDPAPAPWWAPRLMGQMLVLQQLVADYYELACEPHRQAELYWLLRYEAYLWSDHPDYDQSWTVCE